MGRSPGELTYDELLLLFLPRFPLASSVINELFGDFFERCPPSWRRRGCAQPPP